MAGLAVPDKADGYAIWVDGSTVYLAGHDSRGALFAAGLTGQASAAKMESIVRGVLVAT